MSQARIKTYQSMKALNYLYKVCNRTHASRSDSSFTSIKIPSSLKSFSTLNSAATDESFDFRNPNQYSPENGKSSGENGSNWSFRESNTQFEQNPNGVYRENSMGSQMNPSGVYDQRYNYVNNHQNHQNNILQHSSNRVYEENRIEQGFGQHVETYQQQSSMCSEQSVGGNWVNNGYASSNQQSSGMNYQIPLSYSQPVENSDEAGDDGRLHGTIEELDAFIKEKNLNEAVEVLGLLEQNKVSVDIPRYLFLMNECGEAQALNEAKQVHEHLTRSVTHLDVRVYNKILEMYSKCGSMEDAYKVFDKMPQRNLTSWDTMITGLANNNHGEDAIEMFTEFKTIGLKPDNQMFFGLFTACSVVGDMKEGLLHFESMTKTYNITPSKDHYISIVDMLGSAGYIHEALEFIEKMPMEPTVEFWEVLMNNCRIHGDTELGDRCADFVDLLDPSRLTEQSKAGLIPVKDSDIAKEKEKKRVSGLNPLDIKTKVYEYRAGDTSHPDHEKLYSQLRCLKQPMKEVGYVPETKFVLHDIDQESKEEALLSHSERLALSQALLTSPARAPIRIIKNLRVCGDCHNALKIISKIVGRLIVARDAKRFHHFENGVCSCGDYW